MDTDKITENLCNKALKDEREQLQSAASTYRRAIKLVGTSEVITVEASLGPDVAFTKDGKSLRKLEVFINSVVLTEAITDTLMKIRKERIRAEAVTDFLKKFSQFGECMRQMEEHQE